MDANAPRPEQALRLAEARRQRGFETAKEAADYFGWNYTTYSQHERGERGLTKKTADRYGRAYRVAAGWLLTGEAGGPAYVPVVGYVGAGQAIYPFAAEEIGEAEAPAGTAPDTVAVKVRGDSMHPVYMDGDALYYDRRLPPSEMLNRRAIVELTDGRMFVKTVKRGSEPGLFTLTSFNAPDIEDVQINWAAPIRWVQPGW